MRKFIGWLGGIASAVITAVLIFHFTTPKSATTFEGMVYDVEQNTPIKQAMVEFDVEPNSSGSGPFHDFTDENGSYKMEVSDLPSAAKVTWHAKANGYQNSRTFSLSSPGPNIHKDFDLKRVATPEPSPTPPPHNGATPAPTAAPTAVKPPFNKLVYVPRAFSQKFSVKAGK